jgi:transcriptional regulator with XRE-family HTH domain
MDGLAELARTIDKAGTRAEFAEKAKISEPYLSNILSGRKSFTRIPVETAMRISAASGMTMEQLVGQKSGDES